MFVSMYIAVIFAIVADLSQEFVVGLSYRQVCWGCCFSGCLGWLLRRSTKEPDPVGWHLLQAA